MYHTTETQFFYLFGLVTCDDVRPPRAYDGASKYLRRDPCRFKGFISFETDILPVKAGDDRKWQNLAFDRISNVIRDLPSWHFSRYSESSCELDIKWRFRIQNRPSILVDDGGDPPPRNMIGIWFKIHHPKRRAPGLMEFMKISIITKKKTIKFPSHLIKTLFSFYYNVCVIAFSCTY